MTVSVIIPTYNAEAVLERAVRSVEQQEVETEIIVADDASTDATVAIARDLGCVVLTAENNSGGPNRGRNRGLRAARGEWIALLDQDDEFLPGKLHRQAEAGAPVTFTGLEVQDACQRSAQQYCEGSGDTLRLPVGETFRACLRRDRRRVHYPSSFVFHRSLKEILFEEELGLLDYDWQLRLLKGRETAYVDAPLLRRHVDGGNLSLDPDYGREDFSQSLSVLEKYLPDYPEAREGIRKLHARRARFLYVSNEMERARGHFRRAGFTPKHAVYFLTSYVGHSFINKHCRVLG